VEASVRDVVEREIRIDASPETVFAYFTDPARMTRWKGRSATLDPRPGGAYRVEINDRAVVRGEFVEVTPYSRLVFTWGWEGSDPEHPVPPGSSTVEVVLEPDGGGTLVRLRHRDLPAGQGELHDQGWTHYLGRLGEAAAGRDPGPDPLETQGARP
jgi:uncharacterized protein YndB with AHSA1/START domain